MAFVNEMVPEQDIDKYGLREINKKFLIAEFDYEWTVDRDRDIYLRWMKYDHQEPSLQQFTFYWKGSLFRFQFQSSGEGVRGGKGSTTWSWKGMWPPENPKDQAVFDSHKDEIIADLKDALRAFKDFGLGSTIADHTAHFNF